MSQTNKINSCAQPKESTVIMRTAATLNILNIRPANDVNKVRYLFKSPPKNVENTYINEYK